jgi:predicted translin family RNA/ssDNA-binding protein
VARTAAKRAVALARQDGSEEAARLIAAAEKELTALTRSAERDPALIAESFYRDAVEEYAEALALRALVAGGRLVFPRGIAIDPDEILGALADATGEIVRRAVSTAHTEGALAEIERYLSAAEEISQELALVSHTGKLRQKHDEVERNLRRLEQLIYEARGRG